MTGDIAQGLGLVYFTNAYNGTSLVEALASPVLGEEHPARNRADYDRYDDPRLLALRSVQRAAVERGADAARARLRAIYATPRRTRPSLDDTPAARRVLRRARPRPALDRSAPAAPWPTPRTPPARISHSAGHWSRPATCSRPSSRIGARWRWTPIPATRDSRSNGRRTA